MYPLICILQVNLAFSVYFIYLSTLINTQFLAMVKKLLLVRHAEASHDADRDFDRPLTPSGQVASRLLANWIEKQEYSLNKIFSSEAKRAATTATIISEVLGTSLKLEEELYESSVRTFLKLINEVNTEIEVCAFIAHNPTITYLAEYITGEPLNMETAGMVEIDFEMPWNEIGEKSGSFKRYLSSSELAG